ncbi:MAG: hypothetical protein V7K38_10095 [Nostoc sp.]
MKHCLLPSAFWYISPERSRQVQLLSEVAGRRNAIKYLKQWDSSYLQISK